ncbi:MAG: protein imuB [Caulobacteraceae bacterium]|nr:protein imuB [Caulobacteraceae bacterium]
MIKQGAVRRLHGIDSAAARLGLQVGQKAADAQALVPDLQLEPADIEAQDLALARLCDWCSRFSPAVAEDRPDGLYLDLQGVSHLWGEEAGLLADLEARLAPFGVRPRFGLADTAGAAWALARFGAGGAITPPGGQGKAIATLPIAALRLDPDPEAQLLRLGIGRIGRLAAMPRPGLSRRFGPGVVLRLDQALGQLAEPIPFRRPPTPWLHRLRLMEPISTPEDMARVASDLAEGLCARLAGARMGARRFEFTFHRLDGASPSIEVNLAAPGRHARSLVRLLGDRLGAIDPGFGVEEASLAARVVERIDEVQAQFGSGAPADQTGLTGLIESLSNRLGARAVWRPVAIESHQPERTVLRQPAIDGRPQAPGAGWDPAKPRPIRLFAHPEPIEATAPLPDDPPLQFRWRGQLHRVRRAEGPERISREWWRQPIDQVSTGQLRDYYRVEDEAGGRFWLFRAGLHDGEAVPRWWLHGVFA